MARDDKIIRKMKQNRRNVRFSELDGLLTRRGFESKQRGSHVTYRRDDGMRFTVTRHGSNPLVDQNIVVEVLERLGL
jgi:predicted RNA binding protein YcfA (HicA-like mRNA interferase family)